MPTMMASRYFALIPAAGCSSRMGRPKLLLPLNGRPLIGHAIDAWRRSRVERAAIVVRPGDDGLAATVRALAAELQVSSSRFQVEIVVPDIPPPDMKASVQAALAHIDRLHQPGAEDAFLVAPADMPRLSPAIIDRLIERHSAGDQSDIFVPTIAGQRGHPVLFPWPLAAEVFRLGANEGLNAIVERQAVQLVACDDLIAAADATFIDIDTPEQFRQMANEQGEGQPLH